METTLYVIFAVVVIVSVLILFALQGIYLFKPNKKTTPKKKIQSTPKVENYDIGPALWLYNYLNKELTAIYYSPDGKTSEVLYPSIKPETTVGIPKEKLDKLGVIKGGKIQFKLNENGETQDIYDDYLIEDLSLPKNIYIGLITTKTLHFTSPVIYGGVYEMTFINIHNRLSIPLTFNGHIHVPANGRVIYNGYNLDGGVAVGEILSNDEGFFNPFEIEIPVSDVYFGAVSDQNLPVYQGNKYLWQGKL